MKKSIFHYALSSLLVGGIALSVTSCADDDINPNQGNDGDALVRFSINDVQEQAVSRGLEMTRGAIANGITTADLAGHKLAAHSNRNLDVCLIETTVEGINPVKADARTRANIETTIAGDFSSTGIRGVAATSILTTPDGSKLRKPRATANSILLFAGRLHSLGHASLLFILLKIVILNLPSTIWLLPTMPPA